MLYYCMSGIYFTEEPEIDTAEGFTFPGNKTLILNPRQDGSMVTRPLAEGLGVPTYLFVPRSAMFAMSDVGNELRVKLRAALSGIVIPPAHTN